LGNLLVGPFALTVGTEQTLWSLIGFLFIGFLIAFFARNLADAKPKNKETDFSLGLKTLFNSRYLIPLAVLACIVQIVTGLIDYKFNGLLQENYTNIDARTEILGNLGALINTVSIAIQLCMGPILRVFGIGNTFKSIPLLLSAAICLFIMQPQFMIFLVLKIANKSFDYSLFRGVKEILYIPLSREEKTQGKGIIDIFMYRVARGFSSLILMALIALGFASYVIHVSLVLALAWLLLASLIVKRYQNMTIAENA
jgi:ATP/ADP translocase